MNKIWGQEIGLFQNENFEIFVMFPNIGQILGKWQKFQNFHFEKVGFPAPKSRSDCFPHVQNEIIFAPEGLDIVLDTYKAHFGWLEAAVKLKREFLWNWTILTKIWASDKNFKISFWKSPISWLQISFRLLPTPSKWS